MQWARTRLTARRVTTGHSGPDHGHTGPLGPEEADTNAHRTVHRREQDRPCPPLSERKCPLVAGCPLGYNENVSAEALTRDDVMTAEQVARVLHCSRRRVYDLARRDELPGARHLGRTLIVVRPVFETWLLTGRRTSDDA